jgi:cytochrome c oxidase subunit 4
MEQHTLSRKTYFLIFGALMVLTLTTVGVDFLDLGPFNIVAALTIAVIKAVLVVLYFMHLRYSERLNWVFVGAGVFWLGILLVLTMSDYISRGWDPRPPGWTSGVTP